MTDHNPLAKKMKKTIRFLTDRMQKFREAIQTYNVTITHVRGVHNKISDALSRAPLGSQRG